MDSRTQGCTPRIRGNWRPERVAGMPNFILDAISRVCDGYDPGFEAS